MTDNHNIESLPDIGTGLSQCTLFDSNCTVDIDSVTCCVLDPESDQLIKGEHLLSVNLLKTCCI